MSAVLQQDIEQNYRRAALFLAKQVRATGERVFLVSAARPGEGTTTVALNMAVQLAANHALHPLVVELNCRRAGLEGLFSLDARRTLSGVLAGEVEPTEAVQVTASGLSVVPAGAEIRQHGWRPGYNAGLDRMLRTLAPLYDVVIVDTPALRTHTDALVAGAVVPRLVLVVESGRTVYEVLQRVEKDLAAEQVTIVGCVLNKHRRFIPRWLYRWLSP